jgi:hypothetical protein
LAVGLLLVAPFFINRWLYRTCLTLSVAVFVILLLVLQHDRRIAVLLTLPFWITAPAVVTFEWLGGLWAAVKENENATT